MNFAEAERRLRPMLFDETVSADAVQAAVNEALAPFGVALTVEEAEQFRQRVCDQVLEETNRHIQDLMQQK